MKPWCGLFRSGSIGDSLMASSAVAQLAKTHNVEVICDEPFGCMWQNNPHVAKLTEMPKDTFPQDQLAWHDWFRKRAREYDKFYNLSHSCEALLALQPIQSWFDWPASMRRRFCGYSYLEAVHDICEVPHDFDPGPRFYPTDAEIEDAIRVKKTVGERFIGVALSGSRLDKIWPWMGQFVAKVLREVKIPVVLFGGPTHDVVIADRVKETVEITNGNTRDLHCCITKDTKELTVEWSIRRSLAQIQTADVVISPDTGMAWSVAMSPMPKIMLLSHASPLNITSHWKNTITLHADQSRVPCWPCHQLHSTSETCTKAEKADAAACITDIHDAVVMDHLVRALTPEITISAPQGDADNALQEGYVGLRRII